MKTQINFSKKKRLLILLRVKYFQIKTQTQGTGIKILTLKHIIQRFPIALAQVKAGNTSVNLLKEIRQIVYSLYQAKEIIKKYVIIF